MARPANANPQRTRERLIEAARPHLATRGFDATSLRDVATDAGVTVATVHHYFGNKQGLLDACLEHTYSELTARLAPLGQLMREQAEATERAAAEGRPLDTVLAEAIRTSYRFARTQREALQLIMRPLIEDGALDPRWRDLFFGPFLTQASATLAAALGRPQPALRLALQSIVALGMRYALSDEAELAWFGNLPARTKKQRKAALQTIEDHLVDTARKLLLEV